MKYECTNCGWIGTKLSSASTGHNYLDGKCFVCGDEVIELKDSVSKPAILNPVIVPIVTSKPKLTEEQVYAMNKKEQLKIIQKLELVPARLEADRVKQILEAQ